MAYFRLFLHCLQQRRLLISLQTNPRSKHSSRPPTFSPQRGFGKAPFPLRQKSSNTVDSPPPPSVLLLSATNNVTLDSLQLPLNVQQFLAR